MAQLTGTKAKKILKHGSVHGKKLTAKQRGYMGARAGGAPMRPGAAPTKRRR